MDDRIENGWKAKDRAAGIELDRENERSENEHGTKKTMGAQINQNGAGGEERRKYRSGEEKTWRITIDQA